MPDHGRVMSLVPGRANDTPQDEYRRQLQALESTTAMSQSIPGGIGTFFTSLVVGVIVAVFRRRK